QEFANPLLRSLIRSVGALEEPTGPSYRIVIRKQGSKLTLRYEAERLQVVRHQIKILKTNSGQKTTVGASFIGRQLANDLGWIVRSQLALVRCLVGMQYSFVKRTAYGSLKPLTGKNVADRLNLHPSTISRLLKHLELELPNGRIIAARALLPS